jgi:hypothetical protein
MLKFLALFYMFLFSVSLNSSFASESKVSKNVSKLLLKKNCYKCDLEGANLDGVNLEGASLKGADLTGASLVGADLSGANFEGADLRGADFEGAELDKVNFKNARLEGADLERANLEGANLDGAQLDGTKISLKDLAGVKFKGKQLGSISPEENMCEIPCGGSNYPASVQQQHCLGCIGLAFKKANCPQYCLKVGKSDTKNPLYQKCINCFTQCWKQPPYYTEGRCLDSKPCK